MKHLLAAIITIGLIFFAPAAYALTLDEVDGVWQFDIDNTIAGIDDEELKEAMVDEFTTLQTFTITINKSAKTMTLMMGNFEDNEPEKMIFTLPGEKIVAQTPANGLVLVMEDESHLYIEKVESGIKIGETEDFGKTAKDILFFKK